MSLVPHGGDGFTIPLHDRFSSLINSDDGIASLVIADHQIDDQLLGTTSCGEEASALLDFSNHVEGREVLDPASIRNEPVAEGM